MENKDSLLKKIGVGIGMAGMAVAGVGAVYGIYQGFTLPSERFIQEATNLDIYGVFTMAFGGGLVELGDLVEKGREKYFSSKFF